MYFWVSKVGQSPGGGQDMPGGYFQYGESIEGVVSRLA